MTSTPIAKMVREMISRGVDPEVIELAVATAEQTSAPSVSGGIPVDHSAEKRRAYDRERKRKSAELRRNSTGNPQNDDSALTILEVKQDIKLEKKVRAKQSRGELLPPDAKPSAEHYTFGIQGGFNRDWVDQQFEDMRIWARTNEHRAVARKSDWNLTFTGWLRRAAGDAKGRQNGNRTGNPSKTGHAAFLAAAARKAERMFGDGELAGAGETAEFPERDGVERGRTEPIDITPGRAAGGDRGDKSRTEGVLEGEILAPDKNAYELPNGRFGFG